MRYFGKFFLAQLRRSPHKIVPLFSKHFYFFFSNVLLRILRYFYEVFETLRLVKPQVFSPSVYVDVALQQQLEELLNSCYYIPTKEEASKVEVNIHNIFFCFLLVFYCFLPPEPRYRGLILHQRMYCSDEEAVLVGLCLHRRQLHQK